MGCFNQSCNLTHIDINSDDLCLMLPILPNDLLESLHDGPFRLFKPFCLPILGSYDHYGRIENIHKDRNTELLEKYFEMSIEDFVECISGRNDIYGEDSVIQRVYGKGNIDLTPEDLEKIHFKTGADKVVTHPCITHLNECLKEFYKLEGKKFIPIKIYWSGKNELVVEQQDYKDQLHTQSFESPSDSWKHTGSEFLSSIHDTYKNWNSKISSAWGRQEFIFGIPTNKQERAQMLLKLTRSFILPEAYKKIAKTFKSISDKYYSGSKESQSWRKKYFDEYVASVNSWKNAIAIQEKYKGKRDSELTAEEANERNKTWVTSLGREQLFRGGPISDGFKSTYSGEEFLSIYRNVMLDEEFIERFQEFKYVERGMIAANVMLYDNHSLEQHGDINEQLTYLNICVEIAAEVKKQRDADC